MEKSKAILGNIHRWLAGLKNKIQQNHKLQTKPCGYCQQLQIINTLFKSRDKKLDA